MKEKEGDDSERSSSLRVLLLAPTRELAEQIHRETERLSAGRRFRIGIVKKSVISSSALDGQVCSG
jgi:superfamily II DNA/RNA helicase